MAVKPRQKRKELPTDVAQGQREQTDYEKAVAKNEPVEDTTPQPQFKEDTTPQPQFKEDTTPQPQFNQESGGIIGDVGRVAGKAKNLEGVGGFATNLVAAPFRGAERLALEFLDIIGIGSDEQIEDARRQLNLGSGAIYADPDVQDLALTAGTAGLGKAVIGARAGVKAAQASRAAKEIRAAPALADLAGLSRAGTTIRKQQQIMKNIPNIAKKFVKVGGKPVTQQGLRKVGKGLRQMGQTQKVRMLNRGVNWAKRNKLKASAIGLAAGANATWYWGASDNIATGASMRVNEAVDAVRFSGLPKAQAQTTINQAKAQANLVLGFQIASQLNPAISLTGGWVMIANTLAVKRSIEEQERNLALL